MATTYADIHIKVKSDVKNESEKVLNQIGISMTDLINMTLHRVIRERQIPFSTKIDDRLPGKFMIESKEQLLAILDERKDEDQGECMTVDEAWANLERHSQKLKKQELEYA